MAKRLTAAELIEAWRYARHDAEDNFVFDVIDHKDVEYNLKEVAERLEHKLAEGSYTPKPLWRVEVPKNDFAMRPGAVISLGDKLVLYALVRRLAPALERELPPNVYSYRPGLYTSAVEMPLFTEVGVGAWDGVRELPSPYPEDTGFHSWFRGWLCYQERSRALAKHYPFCAVADITSFFENISVPALFTCIAEVLDGAFKDELTELRGFFSRWKSGPGDAAVARAVLPQGNDISRCLANFSLLAFDRAMEAAAGPGRCRYLRYVDDARIFTVSREEGYEVLRLADRNLHELGFELQPVKTAVLPAAEVSDKEVDDWLEKMSSPGDEAVEAARDFLTSEFTVREVKRWAHVYSRALSVLQQKDDDLAVRPALRMFLEDATDTLLAKNFVYLRHFAARHSFAAALARRLESSAFLFAYHKYYLYRLAAYCPEDSPALRAAAKRDIFHHPAEWYCRMAALFCLHTFALDAEELAEVDAVAEREIHPAVARAALVTLRQRGHEDISAGRDRLLFFVVPGHEYLHQYFTRLSGDEAFARAVLTQVQKADVASPAFISRLHQLDLLKNNAAVAGAFADVVAEKLSRCEPAWTRLRARLEAVRAARAGR